MTVTSSVDRGIHSPPDASRPSAGRHPWLDQLCGWLDRMAVGAAAAGLLEGELPEEGAVVVLPTWSWTLPHVDVGRKGVGYDREPLRLPVRLCWSCGPVLVHAAGTRDRLGWHGTGLGLTDQGDLVVDERPGGADATGLSGWDDDLPDRARVRCVPTPALRAELGALARAGHEARWELMAHLESRYVGREMTLAAARVVAEVSDGAEHGLDELTIETLVSRFVYGDPGQDSPSPLSRLLDHALTPSQFHRVDPARWLVVALRRDAERFIRHYLGDPGVGPKVRRLARELGSGSLDDLVTAYQERHPRDRVAHHRAISALTINTGPLLAGHHLDPDHREEAAS